MTVTTATISLVSDYVLSRDYTATDFTTYKEWAEDQFALDDPGVSSALADRAVALLICHYISLKPKGKSNKLSAKVGDTYYTYAQNVLPTSFMGEYKTLIENVSTEIPSTGVQRADYDVSNAFHLSTQPVPDMSSIDESITEADLNNVDSGL
jgi:hypothetical protein